MSSETGYFLSHDGLKLYYRHWDVQEPKAILCIVHGLGEHSNRYQHFAHSLAEHGISVFALDLRGHGLSQGKKGHTPNSDLLLSDVEELLKTARAEYTDLPMYLFGQSLGGNIVANYVLKMNTNELAGYILCSPWLRLAFTPPKWKTQLANVVGKVFPKITQPHGLKPEDFTHDAEAIKAYKEDPMVHQVISAALYLTCSANGEEALRRANEITLKGLAIHGTIDPIVDWKATREFAQTAKNVTWSELPNVLHEPLHDIGKEEVMGLITDWMSL